MANAIGIRVYQIDVHRRGDRNPIALNASELAQSVIDFVWSFISKHRNVIQNDEKERSWFFEARLKEARNNRGYIHYGTFGFESDFIDNKTKKKNYRRKITDVEEIPLYYEFWFPAGQTFGLVAFQSFQGRSCINLALERMRDSFEAKNKDYMLRFRKLAPSDLKGRGFSDAPVKNLRLVKRNAPGDIADRYFSKGLPDVVDVQFVISARRKSSLGRLGDLMSGIKKSEESVITHEGIDFPEAIAEIKFGGRNRRVSVLGVNGDSGVIDISDAIDRGVDGHPTFGSLKKETDKILKSFHRVLRTTP